MLVHPEFLYFETNTLVRTNKNLATGTGIPEMHS